MQHSLSTSSQPTATDIEPKLLTRVVKGDRHALSQLYDQSSTLLYSLGLRILQRQEEVAELLHNLYLDIANKAIRYDAGRGTPMTWLLTLTRSRAIDRLRMRASQVHSVPNELKEHDRSIHTSDHGPNLLAPHGNQELRSVVCNALASLSPAQQQVIELAFYEGLSHLEIAERLDQSPGTVKTRIKLGMSKLRESLRSNWEQGEQA